MTPEQKEEYLKVREKVRWLYYNTECTITQCAKHYGISSTKASNMIEGNSKEPRWFLEENYTSLGEMRRKQRYQKIMKKGD